MDNDGLSALGITTIESDTARWLNYDELVNQFAKKKIGKRNQIKKLNYIFINYMTIKLIISRNIFHNLYKESGIY